MQENKVQCNLKIDPNVLDDIAKVKMCCTEITAGVKKIQDKMTTLRVNCGENTDKVKGIVFKANYSVVDDITAIKMHLNVLEQMAERFSDGEELFISEEEENNP